MSATEANAGDEALMRHALAVATVGLATGELPVGAIVALDGVVLTRVDAEERQQLRRTDDRADWRMEIGLAPLQTALGHP